MLFIVVDDLNDWVGHLGGNPQARTPHIDQLAARGVSFTNAHAPATSCHASRTAVLTGMRPSTTGIYSNKHAKLDALDGITSLPQHFRAAGYRVLGGGKIFHEDPTNELEQFDEFFDRGGEPVRAERAFNGRGNLDWHAVDVDAGEMYDAQLVDWAIDKLAEKSEAPLFLAVGFSKPHLPWWVPAEFFDRFPVDEIALPRVLEEDLDDVPAAALKLTRAATEHRWITESGKWRDAVRGYLAAVSFLDQQVGRLLDGLERSPGASDTVVVLWSDHGWHLGEKRTWKKGTLWEETTRIPLVFVAPGVAIPGGRSSRPVDASSIYPTLAELAGLPRPERVEAESLVRLLRNPDAAWPGVAVTTHRRGSHAVRDQRWRYIRYADGGEELYDHAADPGEWTNLADAPEHAPVKRRLAAALPAVEAADRLAPPETKRRNVLLRPAEGGAPVVLGPDGQVRLLLDGHAAAAGVAYEIRDATDPARPLFWDGREWGGRRATVSASRGAKSPRWVHLWQPAVAAGETRTIEVRALLEEDAAGPRRVIGRRRLLVDDVDPGLEIQELGPTAAAGEVRLEGRAWDDACLAGVEVLAWRDEGGRTLYWDGGRWQRLQWWLPAELDRADRAAADWRYRFTPGPDAPAGVRFRARAEDCAGATAGARVRLP